MKLSRPIIALGIVAVLAVVVVGVILHRSHVANTQPAWLPRDGTPAPNVRVKDVSERTLAVFDFSGSGDASAQACAAAVSGSLSESLYDFTVQATRAECLVAIKRIKADHASGVSEKAALEAGRILAVRRVVAGSVVLTNGQVAVTAKVIDLSRPRAPTIVKAAGKLADLAKLQVELAGGVLAAIDGRTAKGNQSCPATFSNSSAAMLIGSSLLDTDSKRSRSHLWQALEDDPGSRFAAASLLDSYVDSKDSVREFRSDARLQALIDRLEGSSSSGLHVNILRAILLNKEFHSEQAEEVLRGIVEQHPSSVAAHAELADVASRRDNRRTCCEEAQYLQRMLPHTPGSHAILAWAYLRAAENIVHAERRQDLTGSDRQSFDYFCHASLREAEAAVKLDPGYKSAWNCMVAVACRLGDFEMLDKAFKKSMSIDTKNLGPYEYYAEYAGLNHLDGDKSQRFLEQADAAFGRDSACANTIRVLVDEWGSSAETAQQNKVAAVWLADNSVRKEPDSERAWQLKARTLKWDNRDAPFLAVAEMGFNKWQSPEWFLLYAQAMSRSYTTTRDPIVLSKAQGLLTDYTREMPYSYVGWLELGMCQAKAGDRAAARICLETALSINPYSRNAQSWLRYVNRKK